MQAARHGPALPRAPVRRARRHCGAPTGRHGAERSARDAERGGVRGEMRSRATCSSTMTRSAVRIPPRIGWKDLTRTPSATPSARPAADGSPSRSSFATDVRSCADDKVAKALPDGCPQPPIGSRTDRACPRLGTARRRVGARIIACGRLPSAAMASKRARWLLPAIYSDDGCSSYDGGSHVIGAARS